MRGAVIAIISILTLGGALALSAPAEPSLADEGTPTASAPVIFSEVLGESVPVDVGEPSLGLGRVTIMPGAVIPVHHHPGTQIGVVVQGTLTYSVFEGSVEWRHASDPEDTSMIEAGQTVEVPVGGALFEEPDDIHQGRNEGDVPVVIYVSTLFPADAPRAIIDEAIPTP